VGTRKPVGEALGVSWGSDMGVGLGVSRVSEVEVGLGISRGLSMGAGLGVSRGSGTWGQGPAGLPPVSGLRLHLPRPRAL
jgi:hypothetical protein